MFILCCCFTPVFLLPKRGRNSAPPPHASISQPYLSFLPAFFFSSSCFYTSSKMMSLRSLFGSYSLRKPKPKQNPSGCQDLHGMRLEDWILSSCKKWISFMCCKSDCCVTAVCTWDSFNLYSDCCLGLVAFWAEALPCISAWYCL